MDNNSGIPDNWKRCNINDVSIKIHYGYTATANKNGGGSKYLRITDIQDNKVNWDTVPFCEIYNKDIEKFELKENDIVFARTGGTVGKSFLIKNDVPFKAVFASYLIRIKLSNYVDQKFIYLFFQSLNYWSQIELGKTGLKTNVNAQILSKLKLNLAPLSEQRAIVSKIEQLFSDLDNGIENFKKAQEQLKIYRQAVLKKAFEGDLTKEWRDKNTSLEGSISGLLIGWDRKNLKEIADRITKGSTPTTYGYKYQDAGINFIKVENITNGKIDLTSIKTFISEEANEFQKRSKLEEDDILFSIAGTIGETCIVKNEHLPANTNQALAIIRNFKKILLPEYLLYQLRSFVALIVKLKARGGAMNNVSLGDLKDLEILIPSKEEQQQILQEIETRLSICDKMEETIAESLQKAESLRQSILKKAFEGKLLNENELEKARNAPDWEPAEKLLERIKALKKN